VPKSKYDPFGIRKAMPRAKKPEATKKPPQKFQPMPREERDRFVRLLKVMAKTMAEEGYAKVTLGFTSIYGGDFEASSAPVKKVG
jgi:hypothetical protein